MKVYIKKTKVPLPYAPLNILEKFNSGTKAKAPIIKIDGQSIEIVNHNNKTPKNIPNTCIPEILSPLGAGIYLKVNINNNEIAIMIYLFISLFILITITTLTYFYNTVYLILSMSHFKIKLTTLYNIDWMFY